MKKMFVIFMVIVMALPTISVFAKETAVLPVFEVSFNGQLVESNYRQFPLIVYKDITYVPMTYFDCRYLGLTTNWDNDTRTLSINKENITCAYRDYRQESVNKRSFAPTVCDFNIIVNNKKIDNLTEEYPLLTFRDVTYFPLTWRFAVEEFGWEYSFDIENGLVINSSNYHTEIINLPNISGSAIFDGQYYYYNGKAGEDNVVYATFHETVDDAYLLYQLPDTNLSRSANFDNDEDDIYISYINGSSPVMSRQTYRKIDAQTRTVEDKKPNSYMYSAHGYSEIGVREDNISVFCENPYFDSATKITYTKDGQTYEMPSLPGRIRVGCIRANGKLYDRVPTNNSIKILGDKIYFMAFDYEDKTYQSGIYVIDTNSNTVKKLIDEADGEFYVYDGWISAMNPNSTMIIYGKSGNLYRYVESSDKTNLVYDGSDNPDMVLCGVTGRYNVYTSLKSIDGKNTTVISFDAYADGLNDPEILISTNTGTYTYVDDGKLILEISDESPNDKVRLLVVGNNDVSGKTVDFRTSDVCTWVSVCGDYLLYGVDGKTVKVNLE